MCKNLEIRIFKQTSNSCISDGIIRGAKKCGVDIGMPEFRLVEKLLRKSQRTSQQLDGWHLAGQLGAEYCVDKIQGAVAEDISRQSDNTFSGQFWTVSRESEQDVHHGGKSWKKFAS